MGLPSAAGAATRASVGCPSGGRRRRGRPGCRDAGHAVGCAVHLRRPPCGRTSVQLVGWTSGVHASGVQGVRCPRDRGDPGVRTDTRPVSAAAAAALSAPRWTRNPSVRGQATLGAAGWTCRWSVSGLVVAARIGPGGTGMVEGCRAWLAPGSTPGLGRRFAGVQAAAPRSPPRRPWKLVQRQVPAGRRGEQGREQVLQAPAGSSWAGCRRAGRPWAGPGGGDHARWSLRWWWRGVVQLGAAIRSGGGAGCGRSAAAAGAKRGPLGAVSTLTCENSGGRDRV
jgi:hypothetical protein